MTPFKRNLSKLLLITLVVAIGTVVSGVIYYLKMGQNEDTLNTLLFRELKQVEGTLQRSLEKIKKTTNYLLPELPPENWDVHEKEIESAIKKLSISDDLVDISATLIKEPCIDTEQFGSTFSFATPSFNTAEIVSQRKYEKITACIKLHVSIHHALMQSVNRFQTVVLVNERGEVQSTVSHDVLLHTQNTLTDFSNETALYVKKINNFQAMADKKDPAALSIQGTKYVDARLSEKDFRVYIHPVTSQGLVSGESEYYLVGFIESAKITEQKLKLSPDLLMWLILGLLLLVAAIPLIKLRFVSTTYAIQQSDKSQIVMGLLLAVGILTIGFNQQLFFGYFKDVKEQQLIRLHQQIRSNFDSELNSLLTMLTRARSETQKVAPFEEFVSEPAESKPPVADFPFWIPSLSWIVDNNTRSVPQCEPKGNLSAYYNHRTCDKTVLYPTANQSASITSFVESAFLFDNKGEILKDAPFLLASDKLAVETRVDVSARNYVKAALAGNFWFRSAASQPFFIERVFNIEDGRKNAFLSSPLHAGPDRPDTFIAVGTRFNSLVDQVLPNNFGFAVIDASGKVLFHSDESLSLLENFYSESNYNRELQVASRQGQTHHPVPMEVIYKGDPHIMTVSPLAFENAHKGSVALNFIPWRLIVFYNPHALQTNNMIMVFLAVFIYMLVIIPACLLLRYLTYQRFWQELCYFDKARVSEYVAISVLLFVASVSIQFQMGVLQTLSSRLLLWGFVCSLLALFLIWRFNIKLGYYSKLRHPLTSFVLIIALFLLLIRLNRQITFAEVITVNTVFSLAGIGTLSIVFIFCLGYLLQRRASNERLKNSNNHESSRFTMGYVWFLVSLIYIGAFVPAALISHSAHEYLLQLQAQFEQNSVSKSIEQHRRNRQAYFSFVSSSPCTGEQSDTAICGYKQSATTSLKTVLENFFPKPLGCISWDIEDRCWARIAGPDTQKTHSRDGFSPPNVTDDLFDSVFSLMSSDTDLVSHLTYAAKADLINAQHSEADNTGSASPILHYRNDLLMLAASASGPGSFIMLLSMIILPLGIYYVLRKMIVQRLMGEHLHDQYRVLQRCSPGNKTTQSFPTLRVRDILTRGHSQLILNATRLEAEKQLQAYPRLFSGRVLRITNCLEQHYSLDEHARQYKLITDIRRTLTQTNNVDIIVAISAVEQISLDIELRTKAIELLYELHLMPHVLLVVISETAPLYRLLNPASYETQAKAPEPDIDEKSAWSKLFSEFEKYYAWSPICKARIDNPFDIEMLIEHECEGWPEMSSLKDKLINFTQATNRTVSNGQTIDDSYPLYWHPEQVVEFMLVHAGPLYRRKWEECTTKEKLILWKIAHGASVNPASAETIGHLVRRCYLFRDKGWHLVNESFRHFILTAESEMVINQWIDNTNTGAWSILRIPIFALLLVLLVVFVYSSGSSLNTILSIATATLGLIPLLIKNFSLLKAGTGTELE